jgi:O-antigen/teichoic acid export membrane protein
MKKDFLIYGCGSILLQLFSFFLMPVYASQFSAEDYGVLVFLQIVATVLGWLLGLGVFSGMWRYYYEVKSTERIKIVSSAFGFSTVINILLLVSTVAIIQLPLIRNSGYNFLLVIVAITSFIAYFVSNGLSLLRLQKKPFAYLKLSILQSLLFFIIVILFVLVFNRGIASVFYGKLIASIIIFLLFFFVLGNYKYLSFTCDRQMTRKMLRFSLPLIPGNLAMWVLNTSDNFFIKHFYTMGDVGTYAFSYKVAMLVQVLLVIPVQQAWSPFILSHIKDKDFIKLKINQMLQLFLAAGVSLVVFLSFFTKDILSLFAKPEYLEGTKIIFIAGSSYIMLGGCALMAIAYHVAEKTKLLPMYFTYGAIVNIVLNFYLINWFGLLGAATATFLSFFVIFLFYCLNINKYFPVKIRYKTLISISIAGTIAYLLSLLCDKYLTTELSILSKLVILLICLNILYLLVRKSGALKISITEITMKLKNSFTCGLRNKCKKN